MCELCEGGAAYSVHSASWLGSAAISPFRSSDSSHVGKVGDAAIDSLLAGAKWGGGIGRGADIEFSFAEYGSRWVGNYGDGEPSHGFRPFNAQQETAALKALEFWSEIADIRFVEVDETSSRVGDIRFGLSDLPDTAWAYYPADRYPEAGDVWLGNSLHGGQSRYTEGTYNFHTMVHEIGHALGLKHPHDSVGTGVVSSSDWLGVSVMSYRSYQGDSTAGGYTNDFYPSAPMLWDIAAIQKLYGANHATRAGDTTYAWGNGERIFECIWDGGGRDVIDCSNQSRSVTINLEAGSWSRIGPAYRWNDGKAGSTPETLAIAHGVTIEDAIGGRDGDVLYGNSAANRLEGNGGWDKLYGGEGRDLLDGGGGGDRMTGGRGADRFRFENGDSGLNGRRDVITDFNFAAGDRIDLSPIDADSGTSGDQAFHWRGSAALKGAAQLGIYRAGSDTIVRASTDGDAATEFEIRLIGKLTPTADWFDSELSDQTICIGAPRRSISEKNSRRVA